MYTFLIMILSIELFFIILKISKIIFYYIKTKKISYKISNNNISEVDLSSLSSSELHHWCNSLFTSIGYTKEKDLTDNSISVFSKNNIMFAVLCKHYIDENDFYEFIGIMSNLNIYNGFILPISYSDNIISHKIDMLPSGFHINILSNTEIINLIPKNFCKSYSYM